jgi:hypothetical protein
MNHHCHAIACDEEVPPKLLFCLSHWRMLDIVVQKAIWKCYRKGQEIDKSPSRLYLVVQSIAVADVAKRERKLSGSEAFDHFWREFQLCRSSLSEDDLKYIERLLTGMRRPLN